MNLDYQAGLSLFSEILYMAKDELRGGQQLIICSPATHLHSLAQMASSHSLVAVGAQNVHHEASGAYTGEISANQVASTGAEYVIIGHSERRAYFQEDEFMLSKKMDLALQHQLHPIFCVGETKEQREFGDYLKVIGQQLEDVLASVSPTDFTRVIIAYEPVWAIGTGLTATAEQAQEVHQYIREKIGSLFDYQAAENTSILYGGSCNAANAPSLFSQKDIDGGLIGGASLKSREFINIAKVFNYIRYAL